MKWWEELVLTFALATVGAGIWLAIILNDGLKSPEQVLETMMVHLQKYGAWFAILDVLVAGLLIRWTWFGYRRLKTID
jgi:hypothetical protein|tara:strand:- start:1003 stop:1236 length:234 start_codon:yes stop_codon:yes gene_type:complete